MSFINDSLTTILQSTATTSSDLVLSTVTRIIPLTSTSSTSDGVGVMVTSPEITHPSPGVIAGSVIGSLAFVAVLALLFVFWRQRKHRKRTGNNTGDDTGPTSVVPDRTSMSPSPSPSVRTISILTTTSVASDLPRRLSQSSRNAYEAEIERLRQQIRYMEEQTQFMQSATPPPSYRSSRRSDVSDPFLSSLTLPPPLPLRETHH
ncbi:uncharacterized protein EV420DRAFT_255855 [Desarmillaria tabescens]|uniref:Transmembrane protein n=1 Tax=Armillaria tabescens TaxID=1929756 RepID=A0AA39KFN2_ARMTA|nr:uncharacterized protein EV420DRAFT_255855 [Desarmillaria tabescens]KAK0460225.1 hypothetical protein EV420DRAFT_255855 [Desarmillaria tabescens]